MNETPNHDYEQMLGPDQTIVSYSGTRHIIGPPRDPGIGRHTGRITTLCGFGLRPGEGPFEAVRDCVFCEREAAEARRKAEAAETLG